MWTQTLGEFIGTFILVLLGDGVVAGVSLNKSKANGAGWIAITLGWGLAVTMGVYAAAFLGPAHLNPAVTLAFAAIGQFPWAWVMPFVGAQMLGALLGAAVVWLHYYPHWEATVRRFCNRPRDSQLCGQLHIRIHRHGCFDLRTFGLYKGKMDRWTESNRCRHPNHRYRPIAWRDDGLCH